MKDVCRSNTNVALKGYPENLVISGGRTTIRARIFTVRGAAQAHV
jgi:hypothetical protein